MQDSIAITSKYIAYSGKTLKQDSLLVYYSIDGGAYQTAKMIATGNQYEYVGYIKGYHYGSSVDYYVFGADYSEHRYTQPSFGALDPHHFNIEEDHTIVEQTISLAADWNWWSSNVDITLAQLKEALGNHGLRIAAQDGKFATYNANNGSWSGNLQSIELGKMYKIKTDEACTITVVSEVVDPADYPIIIYPGSNWIGFIGTESVSINQALSNYTATQGDKIVFNNKFSTFNGSSWVGTLTQLVPGNGYIFKSKAVESQTLIFNSAK
jgi:hypothetical protein